jgi:hypothetical protein
VLAPPNVAALRRALLEASSAAASLTLGFRFCPGHCRDLAAYVRAGARVDEQDLVRHALNYENDGRLGAETDFVAGPEVDSDRLIS